MTDSQHCARTLIGALLAQGVTDFVLAPGSRSAPLALSLDAAARAGLLRLHVRLDERSAGFLALGLAKASGGCVAVATTSGTAVGNLMPAVMEAHHSGVSLVLLTADRPASLVGFGASQTTDQVGMFDAFLRYRARVSSTAAPASWAAQAARAVLLASGATGGDRGVAQLNVELGLPLVEAGADLLPLPARPVVAGPSSIVVPSQLPGTVRTVVLCGDADPATGAAAARLADQAGLPLIAEASSNARTGQTALSTGRLLLAGELGRQIERVIVFGRPGLSRPVSALLARDDVEVIVVAQRSEFIDPGWQVRHTCASVLVEPGPVEWLAAWQRADAERSVRVRELSRGEPLTGLALARLVAEAQLPGGVLCLGNSNPIRDADLAPTLANAGSVYANRGLSGIDGTLATAVGIALGSGAATTVLCGDLSFSYDVAALVVPPGEPHPGLRVVVADDRGGSIFATLEYGQPAFTDSFERVFATPTGLDLVAVASGYALRARRLHTVSEVEQALAEPISGIEVLVVDVDRSGRAALAQKLADSEA